MTYSVKADEGRIQKEIKNSVKIVCIIAFKRTKQIKFDAKTKNTKQVADNGHGIIRKYDQIKFEVLRYNCNEKEPLLPLAEKKEKPASQMSCFFNTSTFSNLC